MSDEVKLLPCDRVALNDRIKQLRAERKLYFDCEGDGVDVLLIDIQNYFDREATRPPIGIDEVVERVARAIARATIIAAEPQKVGRLSEAGIAALVENLAVKFFPEARAAIAAMKDAAQWRCFDCKTVVTSEAEPERCEACPGRHFAKVTS